METDRRWWGREDDDGCSDADATLTLETSRYSIAGGGEGNWGFEVDAEQLQALEGYTCILWLTSDHDSKPVQFLGRLDEIL